MPQNDIFAEFGGAALGTENPFAEFGGEFTGTAPKPRPLTKQQQASLKRSRQPTKFEQEREEGTLKKAGRGLVLGAASGAGIPESQHPVRDLAGGIYTTLASPPTTPLEQLLPPGVLQGKRVGEMLLRAPGALYTGAKEGAGDIYQGVSTGDWERAGHGAGQFATSAIGAMELGRPLAKGAGKMAKAATNAMKTKAAKSEFLAPHVPPGLTPGAEANLATPIARRGTQGVFSAASPAPANVGFREAVSYAAPDLAQIERMTPLQKSGGLVRPDYRPREFVTNTDRYMRDLWQNVREPQIERNAQVQVDLRPLKQDMLNSITQMDVESHPAAVREIHRRVAAMPDYEPLRDLDLRRKTLRAELDTFESKSPSKQSVIVQTRPAIEATKAQYKAVLNKIEDTLHQRGEAGVREFGRRYGALHEVRDALAEQMNTAESANVLHQLHRLLFFRGPERFATDIIANPSAGRKLQGGLRKLAKSELQPPPVKPPNPPRIAGLLPPPGGTSEPRVVTTTKFTRAGKFDEGQPGNIGTRIGTPNAQLPASQYLTDTRLIDSEIKRHGLSGTRGMSSSSLTPELADRIATQLRGPRYKELPRDLKAEFLQNLLGIRRPGSR